MEKPIQIVVTIVVLLLVAITVIAFFTNGLSNFGTLFGDWSKTATARAQCQADCAQLCLGKSGSQPLPSSCASLPEFAGQSCSCSSGITSTGNECIELPDSCPAGKHCAPQTSLSGTVLKCI